MTFVPLWPAPHCNALRKHVDAGLSFSACAQLINEQFGSHYSRNACIGKAKRLGLETYFALAKAAAGKTTSSVKKIRRRVQNKFEALPPVPFVPREADAEPKHLAFEELRTGLCKWPFGASPPFSFCGCATYDNDRPYCPAHHAIAYDGFGKARSPSISPRREAA